MKRPSGRLIGYLSALVVAALVTTGCTFGPNATDAASPATVSGPPSSAQIDAYAKTLPDDPVEAAEAIVGAMFGSDPSTAVAATVAALTRSGIAVTDDDADVVAASDHVFADYLVPIAYVPALANAVLTGEFYTSDEVSSFLQTIGITDEPVDADGLSATLRDWGKDAEDPQQVSAAGAIVRALASHDGSLPIAGSSPRFDPLQFLLLFVQLTGDLYDYDAAALAAASGPDMTPAALVTSVRAAGDLVSECIKKAADNEKTSTKIKKAAKGKIKKAIIAKAQEWVIDNLIEEDAEKIIAEKASKVASAAAEAVSKAGAILQQALVAILMLNGTRITLSDTLNQETHFRHEHGNRSLNDTVTAKVTFDSSLDQKHLACYKLIGIDVPANGPLRGKNSKGETEWQLKWVFGEEIAPNNNYGSVPHGDVLRPQDATLRAKPYTPLDDNGQASLEVMTRTERDTPNEGDIHTVVAEVVAQVEHVKAPDLFDLATIDGGAIVVAGMVAEALALPSARLPITVTYHGQDTYLMQSHGTMLIGMMALTSFDVDYYSCSGLAGPWKGSAGYSVDSAAVGILGQALGASGPVAGSFTDNDTVFSLNEKSAEPQKVALRDPQFGLEVTIENPPKRGEHVDGYVGSGTWLMPGSGANAGDLADSLFDNGVASGMTYEIRGVPEDPRCPGPRFEENEWDD
jgi:hypothetical protein